MAKKKESIHEFLKRRLTELHGQHNRISRETGVPQSTINRIYLEDSSPRLQSVQPLLDWLEAYDKRAARARSTPPAKARGGVLVNRRSARPAAAAVC